MVATGRDESRFPDELRDVGVRFEESDRHDPAALGALLRRGADVVVDCVCFTAEHASMLIPSREDIGSVVLVSSKAVYVDDHGRHSNSPDAPDFGGPVRETQTTLEPSDIPFDSAAGYGPNKVAAEQVLLQSGMPVSVLRPSRIHGVGAARPREWVFVKRVLDRRPAVLLAGQGRGANHPTAAVNLAALVAHVAENPGTRVLNSADPDAPDGLAIARAVAAQLGHEWEEVLLADNAPGRLGDHPWHTWPPFVLDTSASEASGYRPVGSYAETVAAELDWLVAHASSSGSASGGASTPGPDLHDAFFDRFFDYAEEDAWLASHPGGSTR